jgi:RNA polymerase sigma-70 factor (ECF subfamily)
MDDPTQDRQMPLQVGANPERWLDEHGDVLFNYALTRIGNRQDAEELVQDTLVAGLRNVGQFAGNSSVRTWLVGILRNKLIDYLRRKKRRPTTSGLAEEIVDPHFDRRGHWRRTLGKWPQDPTQTLVNREFWEVFARCLSRLPAALREVFVLRESEEMESEEICNLLGISPSNLAVRLHRARLHLRHCLESNWFQPRS